MHERPVVLLLWVLAGVAVEGEVERGIEVLTFLLYLRYLQKYTRTCLAPVVPGMDKVPVCKVPVCNTWLLLCGGLAFFRGRARIMHTGTTRLHQAPAQLLSAVVRSGWLGCLLHKSSFAAFGKLTKRC